VVLDPFFGTGTTGAVAKRMGRNWVGIEREELYAQLAAQRIMEVVPPLVPDEMIPAPLDTPKTRIPFVTLLEHGLISAGEELRLGRTARYAVVQEDGTISAGAYRGSIHRVGAQCLARPSCNGWEHWFYKNKATGEYMALDTLREPLRRAMEAKDAPDEETAVVESVQRAG
jgi:modification methylase